MSAVTTLPNLYVYAQLDFRHHVRRGAGGVARIDAKATPQIELQRNDDQLSTRNRIRHEGRAAGTQLAAWFYYRLIAP